MNEIAKRILDKINEKDISYGELSHITGIPKSALQRYATGETEKIPIDRLEKIARALCTTAAYLMGWEDPLDSEQNKRDAEERDLLDKYNALDSRGKSNVRNVLAIEHLRMKNEKYSIGLNIDDIIEAAAYGGKSETKIKPSGKRGESEKAYRDMMNPHTKDNKD